MLSEIFLIWLGLNVLAWMLSVAVFCLWALRVRWTAGGLMPDAVPFERGEGGDAVLFVHGFNDVPAVWRRFVEPFVEKDFHVEAVHLEGLGERRLGLWFDFPLLRWQQAITDRVNALAKTYRRVFLVGHSMGGALVLDAVCRHGHWRKDMPGAYAPVAGAALLAPLVEVSRVRSPFLPAQAWFGICRMLLPGLRCVPSVFRPVQGAEDDPAFIYRRDRFMSVAVLGAMFGLVRRLRTLDLSGISTPLWVYVAGNDRVVDSSAAKSYFSSYPAMMACVEIPNVPHVLPLVTGWRDIADLIASDFIRTPSA